jgi:isopenicillin-N epimerase
MAEFGVAMRDRFLLERGTDFLNHGSFGAVPGVVAAAADEWRRRVESNPDRFMREILPGALRDAAGRLARWLGAEPGDLVFVDNATAGVTTILRGLDIAAGDEILTTTHAYGAVRQAIRYVAARTGARLVEADVPFPVADDTEIEAAVTARFTSRTRLLVIDHISSPTALIFPVERLCAAARARGIKVLIDGAHAPGQIALDIPAVGADWYVGNCHKWLLAPKGCAFLWARREAQAGLHPLSISHAYEEGFTAEFDWTGTRDFAPWLAVTAALDVIEEIGADAMRRHNHGLATAAARRLSAAWTSVVGAPDELLAAMATLRLPAGWQGFGPPTIDTARRLQSRLLSTHRIVLAVMPFNGALWGRISAQVYNAPGDYDRLAALPTDRV